MFVSTVGKSPSKPEYDKRAEIKANSARFFAHGTSSQRPMDYWNDALTRPEYDRTGRTISRRSHEKKALRQCHRLNLVASTESHRWPLYTRSHSAARVRWRRTG